MVYIGVVIIENEICKDSCHISNSKNDVEKWIKEDIKESIEYDCECASTTKKNKAGEYMLYYPLEGEDVENIKFDSEYMNDRRSVREYLIIEGDITKFENRKEVEKEYYNKFIKELKDYSDLKTPEFCIFCKSDNITVTENKIHCHSCNEEYEFKI